MIASLSLHSDDSSTTFKILAEGACRLLGAEFAALLTTLEPAVVEIGALVGVSPENIPLIETVLSGNPIEGPFKLEKESGVLAQAYFGKSDLVVEELPTSGSSFAASAALQQALSQTLDLRSWWILPLAASPEDDCVGLIILGRSTVTPPTAEDRLLSSAFVAQAAASVKNARQFALTEAGQQMTETAGATLDLSDVATRVLELATQMIACDGAALFLRYGDVMRVRAVYQLPLDFVGAEIPLSNFLLTQMIATRLPLYLADVQADDRFTQIFKEPQVRGWLASPLVIGERVIGQISFYSKRVGRFGAGEARLLNAFARQAGLALENAQLYHEATHHLQQMAILNEIAAAVVSTPDFNESIYQVVEALKRTLHYEIVNLWMMNEAGDQLILSAPSVDAQTDTIRLGQGVSGQVAASGTAVCVDDVRQYSEAKVVSPEVRSQVCVPIRIGRRVIGVIDVQGSELAAFSDDDVYVLSIAAGQLARALENARTMRDLAVSLEQLRQAQAQLVQSGKLAAVGQLAAGVAHEINNPLTTIGGFSEIVLRELPGDSPLRNDVQLILREAQRARDVVRRLLDFARQSEPHRNSVDLNELVREMVSLMRSAASVRDVTIEECYAPELPWASVDANQFKQVVLNLLNNAAQAMPKGGTLMISVGAAVRETRRGIEIKVKDSGVGIPRENLERIFEPFYTTKSPNEGTGLGLAVSYRIVREHDGVIEVESEVNRGTIFTVWIPIGDL
jgi:two-component system NtrC family sensor kinase